MMAQKVLVTTLRQVEWLLVELLRKLILPIGEDTSEDGIDLLATGFMLLEQVQCSSLLR